MHNNKRKMGKYNLSCNHVKNYIAYKVLQLAHKITFIHQPWRWVGKYNGPHFIEVRTKMKVYKCIGWNEKEICPSKDPGKTAVSK